MILILSLSYLLHLYLTKGIASSIEQSDFFFFNDLQKMYDIVKASPSLPSTINPIRQPSSAAISITLQGNSITRMKKREDRVSPVVTLSHSPKNLQGCHSRELKICMKKYMLVQVLNFFLSPNRRCK